MFSQADISIQKRLESELTPVSFGALNVMQPKTNITAYNCNGVSISASFNPPELCHECHLSISKTEHHSMSFI